ncbi:MAG TPA: hypothetical protein VM118_01440 [Acidobacteriota bacterium]|nr:hypothetical protein [Acidobacteriota bacterium]
MCKTWAAKFSVTAFASAAVLGFMLSCVSERGIEVQPVEYLIYTGVSQHALGPDPSQMYVYDAADFGLLDSFPVPSTVFDMAASPDGNALYLQMDTPWPDQEEPLVRMNAKTKEIEWSVTGNGPSVQLLKAGRLLLNGHDVLDPGTGRLLRQLPDSLSLGRGPASGTQIAAIATRPDGYGGEESIITALDIETSDTHGSYLVRFPSGGLTWVYYARLHSDGKRVLLIVRHRWLFTSWFVIGDIERGATLLQYRMIYPFGEVAIDDSGRLAVVTDPSWPMIWDSEATVDIFDLETLQHLRRFSRGETGRDSQVRFLPDRNRIVTGPIAGPWDAGPLHVVDLVSLTVSDTIYPPSDSTTYPGALAIAVRP